MSHVQTVSDYSLRHWTVTLPDQITLLGNTTFSGGTAPHGGVGSMTVDVHYDLDALFGDANGKLTVTFQDPLGGTLFDLRAPMRIVFHNDLGVPIDATNGAASVVVYAHANSDVFGSSDAPPLYTNFSGLTAEDFPGFGLGTHIRDTALADPVAGPDLPLTGTSPNYFEILGTIPAGASADWGVASSIVGGIYMPGGVYTLTQPDRLSDDSFTLTFQLGPNAIDAASMALLKAQWDLLHPPPIKISAGDARATEGGDLAFAVTLDRTAATAVTVHYEAVNGTAKAGEDFLPTAGDLTFAAGETSKTVIVHTQTDGLTEGNETLTLALTTPTGAQVGTNGTGTVLDAPPPPKPAHPLTHDFNGDGTADILLAGADGSHVVWTQSGGTVQTNSLLANIGDVWSLAAAGDLSGDGKADLLFRGADGQVLLWTMNGGQIVAQTLLGNPTNYWHIAGTGDFNGDGKADILWTGANGEVDTWDVANGQANFLGAPGAFWSIAGTGDFSGDGKTDILWRGQDGTVAFWTMDGGRPSSASIISNPGTYWHVAGTGYFNDDAQADILWQGQHGETSFWTLGANGMPMGGGIIAAPGAYWSLAGAEDYSGDGQTDLLWRGQGGELAAWMLHDGQVTGMPLLGFPTSFWSPIG
ncbi:FG-GAP-like repeat-containing protein [Roseicella sp. DB1501]|uniref:FG-GAP-like repeat-containing protein n=1 Tax=Roseicella sp. DB1501 TaxID=2730925 RepID=UPI0014914966|nr:FG-GAP-like repeat-containing protein [Roseicella sp. DB1501]